MWELSLKRITSTEKGGLGKSYTGGDGSQYYLVLRGSCSHLILWSKPKSNGLAISSQVLGCNCRSSVTLEPFHIFKVLFLFHSGAPSSTWKQLPAIFAMVVGYFSATQSQELLCWSQYQLLQPNISPHGFVPTYTTLREKTVLYANRWIILQILGGMVDLGMVISMPNPNAVQALTGKWCRKAFRSNCSCIQPDRILFLSTLSICFLHLVFVA